jgi:NAD(P)-dependent dehydrogenase (short-subunit alcohol dehydrogenase family)
MNETTKKLSGKVAVVAGATRGAGRAMAVALGAAGATVYCTGRSTRDTRSDMNRPETIEDTAEAVTAGGGLGIAVRVDHTREDDVRALFERVATEQAGRLDILINDVWGGDSLAEWGVPFWEHSVERGLKMIERGLFSHIITARHAAPLMVARGSGLIIEITDGDSPNYRGALFYDLVKASVIRLAVAMHGDLHAARLDGITALALTPGFLRSEAMLDHFGVTEATWRDAIKVDPYFAESETPYFIGQAVVALATDPNIGAKGGQALATWHLAEEYDFDDYDGRRPHWKRFFDARQVEQATSEKGQPPA